MIVELLIALILLVALLAAYFRSRSNAERMAELEDRLNHLERALRRLQSSQEPVMPPPYHPPEQVAVRPAVPSSPPPLKVAVAPPASLPPSQPQIHEDKKEPKGAINWERFMGVNLFAWLGGFALFLAAAFFVKYSFENNLISPQVRVFLGFLSAIAALGTGLRLERKSYAVIAQTLCATGAVILYADIFAAFSFYSFIAFIPAFILMIIVTSLAFFLACRMNARVIAVLGMLGGFLTPLLLSTGEYDAKALFTYVAFLDAGLVAVALQKRWNFLVLLGAFGTIIFQILWADRFVASEVSIAMIVCAGFELFFLAAYGLFERRGQSDNSIAAASILFPLVSFGFAIVFLGEPDLGARPLLVFLHVLIADLSLIAVPLMGRRFYWTHRVAGVVVFLFLAFWSFAYLSEALLIRGLLLYFGFAILHSAVPILLRSFRPETTEMRWSELFPCLSLIVALIPVFQLQHLSFSFWVFLMLIDLAALTVAFFVSSVVAATIAVVLTLIQGYISISRITTPLDLPGAMAGIAAMSVLFFTSGILLGRALREKMTSRKARVQLPALSAISPFVLLISVFLQLPLSDPSLIFAVASLLTLLLLGLARYTTFDWLGAINLVTVLALEYTWLSMRFQKTNSTVTLAWYVFFYALFTVYPFLFQRNLREKLLPWKVSALSGPLHFFLIYKVVTANYGMSYIGLLPLAFCVAPAFGFWQRMRSLPFESPVRNVHLAWFAGSFLFFVTLIFPVQFDREWITIGWAMEGVALLWLFRRIPHPGLRSLGVALLVISFFRLAVNPAVLSYHERSERPIFNWYLYTYGDVVAALLIGGKLLTPPRHLIRKTDVRAFLYSLAPILAFVLLNIEIADFFAKGSILTFQFSGNFARDMTYSIAWAAYGLIMLIIGIRKRLAAARYGSIALLSVTLIKLFFHDLANLMQLYRVGALVGVAIMLIFASYLYQRFVSFGPKENP